MSKGDAIVVMVAGVGEMTVEATRRGRGVHDWIDPGAVKGPRYLHVEEIGPTGKVVGTQLRVRLDQVMSIKYAPKD